METTLVFIKPDGVKRHLIGEIIRRIEMRNLSVAALQMIVPERSLVEEHYAEHRGKSFYEETCTQLASDPIVLMAVKGENAIKAVRTMMGATNPIDAAPGTVRGDLALSIEANLVHSSEHAAAAERELKLWFK